MNKPNGTELARTEVTQYLINYIKDNNLQNEENKKCIKADNKLYKLLDLNENETLTYFNLQSYMNKHFK
jgi:chromatin remodeling complex protein RSC6